MNNKEILSKRKFFKYNQDNILEILSEYIAQENGFDTFQSKSVLYGEVNKDLRLVTVIGDLEDDDISKMDLDVVDGKMDFNGSH